jgi:glycosyltransferase involved in cell wall biosynthesis
MEGWLCGVPSVVSAACPVTSSHVRRSNGGLFVANSDEFGLALKYLEDNETARRGLAANGRKYVTREFSFDAVLSRYLLCLFVAKTNENINRRTNPADS